MNALVLFNNITSYQQWVVCLSEKYFFKDDQSSFSMENSYW